MNGRGNASERGVIDVVVVTVVVVVMVVIMANIFSCTKRNHDKVSKENNSKKRDREIIGRREGERKRLYCWKEMKKSIEIKSRKKQVTVL